MVTFDGYNLDDVANGLRVTRLDFDKIPKSTANAYKMARSHGSKFTGKTYNDKSLLIEGAITKSSVAELQAKCDELRQKLSGSEKNLDAPYAGATRRFVATLENIVFSVSGTFATWSAAFICYEAFGKDTADTTLAINDTTIITPTSNTNETFGGTHNARPVLTYELQMVEPTWAAKYIEVLNTALNKRLRLTRTWAWFDKFVIDANSRKVMFYPATKTVIDACEVVTGWTGVNLTVTAEAVNMKEGVGCLKGVMGGNNGYCSFEKLNFATAIDLGAAAGKIVLPVYIAAPTAGAVASIRFYASSDANFTTNWSHWQVTTQHDGSALQMNAWNWLLFDLSQAPSNTQGTINRAAIKSIRLMINAAVSMQIATLYLDYIALYKASVVGQEVDFEGIFPDFNVGAGIISYADELTARKVKVLGTYLKRYL